MRTTIILLSVFFFSLSGMVIFKAVEIPPGTIQNQSTLQSAQPKESLPKAEDNSARVSQGREVNWFLVQDRLATKAKGGDELANKSEKPSGVDRTGASPKGERALGVLGDGMFGPGQFFIKPVLRKTVQEFLPEILASPDYKVLIEGHTDDIKSAYMDNMELSYLRARAVALILTRNGIPSERISIVGYGDTRPAVPNETDEGRARNRRVEIKLIPGEKEF